MILFDNWSISCPGPLGMQFDHLSRRLDVAGDLPEGWEWDALLGLEGALDIIRLSATDTGVGAALTREQLPRSGWYHIQLRGTRGDEVRHTDVATVFVPESLSGDAAWPAVPSEFTQMEARLRELNNHPPIPGENGCWMLWDPDAGQYVDSEFPLSGGDGGGAGAVRYDKAQELSGGQKGQARDNIGALGTSELSGAINTALAQAKQSGEFDGADGYSPVRGTDYWTPEDQNAMVDSVLAALPNGDEVSY